MKKILLLTASILFWNGINADSVSERVARKPALIPFNEDAEVLFRTPLPSMNYRGAKNGTYNNKELAIPGVLTSKDTELGCLMQTLRNTICEERSLVFVDGKKMMCNKNWIRDHVHEMKAYRHWEYDLCSFLDFIIDNQREDGCFFELIKQFDDPHWAFVSEKSSKFYPVDNLALVRLEIEADIEYIVVEGAKYYFQVTGDKDWLEKRLPALEKGINYLTSGPDRWDAQHELVKRGYTIDTWDFTLAPGFQTDRSIHEGVPMAIMHGDNSGAYQAMNQLAWMNRILGKEKQACQWEKRAEKLKGNMFKYLWNGRFFIHQLPVGCAPYDDKESIRLSLSNTYDMNRGVTNIEQSRSIIEEYLARKDTTSSFAEWFSIDPPYVGSFTEPHGPGKYVNGAISPFTAGELAKAAFNNGYEEYGWNIITRLNEMIKRDGSIYFLYSPYDSKPQGGGPSAWGAAALLSAIDEGLAGITDTGTLYSSIDFSPRFPVSGYDEVRYFTGYEKSDVIVDLRYVLADNGIRYRLASPARDIRSHIYIPQGKKVSKVKVNGKAVSFKENTVGQSNYVDFSLGNLDGLADMEILF